MVPYLDTQEAVVPQAEHCRKMGYPGGRSSSVSVGVSLIEVAGALAPRVPQVQQVKEGPVDHQQLNPSPHDLSPQQQDQVHPVGLHQGVLQQGLGLEADVSLLQGLLFQQEGLMAGAEEAEVVHSKSCNHHHSPHHQTFEHLEQVCHLQ